MRDTGIRIAFRTDKGRRPENEDSALVLGADELGFQADALLIVADGMGGRASGQVASRIAVDTVRDSFVAGLAGVRDLSESLAGSLQAANLAVYREASSKPELQGMGTTCVVAAVRDGMAHFAHLGDSRIYLLREGHIRRLTEDHSFVAEKIRTGEITEDQARRSRFRNIITRAIGLEPTAQPSVGSIELEPGDVLLLCSDGLSGPVTDNQIADILCSSSDPEEACGRLVSTALRNGGTDNITVVIAAYGAKTAAVRRPAPEPEPREIKVPITWIVPLLAGLLLGMGIGLYPGYLLFHKQAKPIVKQEVAKPDLALVTYTHPSPLTYVPLQPGFLALDGQGSLHVVDTQGRRLIVDKSGQVLKEFPVRDTFKPLSHSPSQMAATDSDGNLYVSDPAGKKILKFGKDGLFIGAIGEGKLTSPEALVIAPDGSIFTIDGGRLKIIRVKQPGTTDTTDAGG